MTKDTKIVLSVLLLFILTISFVVTIVIHERTNDRICVRLGYADCVYWNGDPFCIRYAESGVEMLSATEYLD